MTSCVTGDTFFDSVEPLENGFHAPEAAASDDDLTVSLCGWGGRWFGFHFVFGVNEIGEGDAQRAKKEVNK